LEPISKWSQIGLGKPNQREWDLQDVENWFETEGSVGRRHKKVLISQKDRRPLEEICKVLRRELGFKNCPITHSSTGYNLQLPIEESAKFVKFFKTRVKTAKALKDLEELERLILGPAKFVRRERRRAREALLSA
jgi:hypothetical protein